MKQQWVAAWGCPTVRIKRNCAEWMKDVTVRFTVLPTLSGERLRLRFSNLFGTENAVITRATVGSLLDTKSVSLTDLAEIRFNGNESGTMAPRGALVSDPVAYTPRAGVPFVVSLYFQSFTALTTGQNNSGPFIEKWVAEGDCTHQEVLPLLQYAEADAYPFIHTIEILAPETAYGIVAFGDSITAQSWPDHLARRLLSLGKEAAVVRKGISGGRVLREYPCDLYCHYGPSGLSRFEREITLPGVQKVFILHGINDIIHPGEAGNPFRPASDLPRVEELIAGLQAYIDIAHRHKIAVYLAPILPFEGWRTYHSEKEALREQVNFWIYKNAPVEGVLPFETTVLDPQNPLALLKEYDSGDHLHPSVAGAKAMAECIPEEWL